MDIGESFKEELHWIDTEESVSLALWKLYQPDKEKKGDIFLTHGTFSDKRVCRGIASFMAEKGYTSWTMEWREHGASKGNGQPFNFESIGLQDIPAILQYLREEEKIEKLHAITHSGGGICLSMALIEYVEFRPFLKSMSLFGCQAFGAANNRWKYLRILFGHYLSALMGNIPGRRWGRPHDESFYTMKQWNQWNLSGKFLGENGRNYQEGMSQILCPVLSIAAKADQYIAPPEGCKAFLESFGNPDNRFWLLSKDNGNLEDYDHARILHSSSAAREVWPEVLRWIEKHN
ncbi:MAG: alpha/beta hydrolase [Bacteroidota bacterium]